MAQNKSVLLVGIDPVLIDFSKGDFANMDLTSERVLSALRDDSDRLNSLGYEVDSCMTDFGETAAQVVARKLQTKPYACVMIGAGVRVIPSSFRLFEQLINVVHENAPQAKICFNTRPNDTAEAVMRWI